MKFFRLARYLYSGPKFMLIRQQQISYDDSTDDSKMSQTKNLLTMQKKNDIDDYHH